MNKGTKWVRISVAEGYESAAARQEVPVSWEVADLEEDALLSERVEDASLVYRSIGKLLNEIVRQIAFFLYFLCIH